MSYCHEGCTLVIVANTINIGADLGAMADSVRLLIAGAPALLYVVMFGALCVVLQVFIEYDRYVSVLKWLTLALFAYVGTLVIVKIPWTEAVSGLFIPTFAPDVAFWDHGGRHSRHYHQSLSVFLAHRSSGGGHPYPGHLY
jgi:hypothetical protein